MSTANSSAKPASDLPQGALRLAARRKAYSFEESADDESRRSVSEAAEAMKLLKENIGLAAAITEFDELLIQFATHHHGNIQWYEKRIVHEERVQRFFFAVSLGLLIAIPFVVFKLSADSTRSATLITAQITAALTGIIGVQSALRSWLERRNIIAVFHKASAALKKSVYEFEERWTDCVPNEANSNGVALFKASVKDFVRKARDIESDEEEIFFATKAGYPLIDLRSAVSEAGQSAVETVSRFSWKRPPVGSTGTLQSLNDDSSRSAVDVLRGRLSVLQASAFNTQHNPEQLALIEDSIRRTTAQLRDAEQSLLALTLRRFDRE